MLVDLTVKAQGVLPNTMNHDDSDLTLAQRLAAREDASMLELCAVYGQRLYSYAMRLTGDSHQAEDVVQDALVIVWKTARTFRGDGRLLAWLLGIVHHTALKSLRHRSLPITEEMEESLDSGLASPEQQSERNEQTAQLDSGMRSLSPEHRAVLELVFYQGLNLEEVAQVCRVPLGTIKSRLSYARRCLRGVLTRQGLEEAG
jgi:RNA polymerase sigma-70 factor (ECF subfamily)